jgi:hypothetical protein
MAITGLQLYVIHSKNLEVNIVDLLRFTRVNGENF